jgi:CMP-N,N'-diacetyllegionaminic acid synthase
MSIIGLVPARGGSKSIPRKNLALCGGKSLLAWTADAAFGSGVLDRVVLSTDDAEIAAAGRALGLETPFMRPPEISGDNATMLGVLKHALDMLGAAERIEAFVLLQPTSPLRRANHIVEALDRFRQERAATLVSVVAVPHRFVPSSLMRRDGARLLPYEGSDVGPTLRQEKATLFARNGPAVLIVRPEVIEGGTLYGDPTIGYEMNEFDSLDVDAPDDLRLADLLIRNREQ